MFWNKRIDNLTDYCIELNQNLAALSVSFKRVSEIEKQINLILDHLNLQYTPEREMTEPAKLVTKNSDFFEDLKHGSVVRTGLEGDFLGIEMYKPTEPIFKPKRKYTKRKKSKK